jgi:hypothetical protein
MREFGGYGGIGNRVAMAVVLVGLLTSVTALEKRWKRAAMENPE